MRSLMNALTIVCLILLLWFELASVLPAGHGDPRTEVPAWVNARY